MLLLPFQTFGEAPPSFWRCRCGADVGNTDLRRQRGSSTRSADHGHEVPVHDRPAAWCCLQRHAVSPDRQTRTLAGEHGRAFSGDEPGATIRLRSWAAAVAPTQAAIAKECRDT